MPAKNVKKNVNLIACIGPKNELGNHGKLLYSLKGDMMRFRTMTINKTVIMGRKTWDSLPEKNRPLPYRENIVVSRNPDFKPEGAIVCSSIMEAIEKASNEQVWIIGGGQIYSMAMKAGLVNNLYITHVNKPEICDTYFPEIKESEWRLTDTSGIITDEKDENLKYQFAVYSR